MGWTDYITPGNDKFLGGVLPTSDKYDRGKNEFRDVDPSGKLGRIGQRSGDFGDFGRSGYRQRTQELGEVAGHLGGLMRGENSLAAEGLRQGMQQNIAGQQSMAAGARGGNQAMAARAAMMGAGRANAALGGQQAMAGIAERNAAAQSLGGILGQMRGQDLNATLGGYGQHLQGQGMIEQQRGQRFGQLTQQPTSAERGTNFIKGLWESIPMGGVPGGGGGGAPGGWVGPPGGGYQG